MMWPPPQIVDPTPTAPKARAAAKVETVKPNYFQSALRDSFMYTAGLTGLLGQ